MTTVLAARASRSARRAAFAAAATVLLPAALLAQSVPTGIQSYHVVGNEQHVWTMMQRVATGEGLALTQNGMNSTVSAISSADNQIIYYDHWEDGFEADPFNPVQATRLVVGDGNPANGRACDWTTDPRVVCGTATEDMLFQGTAVTFNSDQGLTGAGVCTPATIPGNIRCTVPVNPRNPAHIRFDGGDLIYTSGGPLSLIHSQDPLSPFIGGATEMISRQAVGGATSYTVPIGQDIFAGDNTPTEPFKYVDINLVAFEDGTQVFVNSPGAGNRSFTLNKGQHYSSRGFIDSTAAAGGALTINAGTKVSTTKPIAGMFFTGGVGTYATDFFSLLPDLLHGTDYILGAPGDNPAVNGNRPLNAYIFNPDALNPLTVTITDTLGTGSVVIPPNSMRHYFQAMGRFVPSGSTARLTANRNFWGVAAHDHQGPSNDWGYSWLATRFLTTTYTVSDAPGAWPPAFYSLPANRIAQGSEPDDADCTIPPTGPNTCNSINRSPVFVAATQDSTRVKVDFDNDGLFDLVDVDSNDCPDPGVATDSSCAAVSTAMGAACGIPVAQRANCIYSINTLQVLRVYDYTDYDNTGTRIVANRPVAVTYGQDTDEATGSDPVQDTGYVIYPISQAFLDPVLVLDKSADRASVPSAGGAVVYTLRLSTFGTGSLTNLTIRDVLPAGVSGAAYVAGSTLITYPDLSQGTADPVVGTDPDTGRAQLTWTLSPDTMGSFQNLTVRYTVNVPAGASAVLVNDAYAEGRLGNSIFSPSSSASVVRTNVTLAKSATDDGTPEAGDIVTYSVQVHNGGLVAETAVVIRDPIPPDSTFVTGSVTSAGPFTGSYSAAQNAVIWTAANFPAGSGPHTLTFQVRLNPGVAAGTTVNNTATFESADTPVFPSNTVSTVLLSPRLEIAKSGPAQVAPGQSATFEIQVRNTGTSAADNLLVTDPFPSNGAYQAGTMSWSLNGAPFAALTDAADADEGTLTATAVELAVASLGPGQDIVFRFRAVVTGAHGQFLNNQALVSSDDTTPTDTNLVQVPIIGAATLAGRVFLDLDGNGVQNGAEPGLANVDVLVTPSSGPPFFVTTDASGDYSVGVPAGSTTLNVDETDPDIPAGATLTTANDPQVRVAINGSTVNATPVGYQPRPITVTKTSDALGEVVQGQIVTYTVAVTNTSGVTQTNLNVSDPLPAGTSYVANSAQVLAPAGSAFRVTEYLVSGLVGTSFNLTLNQALAADYFVIVQGSAGDGGNTQDRFPNANYAALTAVPTPIGDLTASGAANRLTFTRGANTGTWSGVITVAECLGSCDTNGFRLRDAQRVVHAGTGVTGTDTSAYSWPDLSRIMLLGGFNGAGCSTADGDLNDHKVCHARLFPSGTNTINWTRDAGGATSMSAATSTVLVVEWGSAWTVQRVAVTNGNNGGGGIDAAGEYNTAALPQAVTRANTWVWGAGHTNDENQRESGEGVAFTLGTGVSTSAVETQVAAGIEVNNNAVNFDLYALTHPDLAVDYRFKSSGDSTALTVPIAVNAAISGTRMAVVSNGFSTADNEWPRAILAGRYTSDTQVTMQRWRTGSNGSNGAFTAWVQGIDFGAIQRYNTSPAGAPPSLASGVTLAANQSLTFTYQVQVDAPLASGITEVQNTASIASTQEPVPHTATVTDLVARFGVTVEYDNAGYAHAGQSVLYQHEVINTGQRPAAYVITGHSEHGWRVDLLHPGTGAVLATDSNGDGTWDGGVVVNTGTLAVGAMMPYTLRVNVPPGTPDGTQDTARLRARSARDPLTFEDGVDETTVLGLSDVGPVIILPDNSGVVVAGGYAVYTHLVLNNSAASDTFDLTADSSQEWASAFFYDSNGDGQYTPGIDVAISNTLQLAPGQSQQVFVVVPAPGGTPLGAVDVTHLTARSRNNPDAFDGATDTTTVTTPDHDLSGGGTFLVQGGDLALFPGTLSNIGSVNDRYDFAVTPSSLFGLSALPYPTVLWVDTNADGIVDTPIASDADGDGTWDSIAAGFDVNGNGSPDVAVAAGQSVAYELRRLVDPGAVIPREFVTFSAIANANNAPDNVTATVLLAAVSRATIRGLRVDPAGTVQFVTGSQRRTRGFRLYEASDRSGTDRTALTAELVAAPRPDSVAPTVYEVRTRPLRRPFVVIEEVETGGVVRLLGVFEVGDAALARGLLRVSRRMREAGEVVEASRPGLRVSRVERRGRTDRGARIESPRRSRDRARGVAIEVTRPGPVRVAVSQLVQQGLREGAVGQLVVSHLGQPIAHQIVLDPAEGPMLAFEAAGLFTVYTGRNVYVVTGPATPLPSPAAALTVEGTPPAAGITRVEKPGIYLAAAPVDADPWMWDVLTSDDPDWPYAWWDPLAGRFDLPDLVPGTGGDVAMELRLVGRSGHEHSVEARLNGHTVGTVVFAGAAPAVLTGTVPAASLLVTGNELELRYTARNDEGDEDGWGVVYLDALDLAAPLAPPGAVAPAAVRPFTPHAVDLTSVEYLIVTHGLFREAADRLAAAKEAQGLSTAVVEVDDVYDRYTAGVRDAQAIAALVRDARGRRDSSLRYVLLLGDDTFDYRDRLGTGDTGFMPSLMAHDGQFGRVPSENRYADVDGDGAPDVAIGRLPARSPEQALEMVARVETQTARLAELQARHLFAVDNHTGDDAPFVAEAGAIAQQVPGAPALSWADVGQGAGQARTALRAAWAAGSLVTHYFGHGGVEVWADENLVTVDDLDDLAPSGLPGVVLAWACESGWFQNLFGPALLEAMVAAENGTLAAFAPSGITSPAAQKALYEAVYAELFGGHHSLGEAIRRGKAEALRAYPASRPAVEGFNLLGDPALTLPAAVGGN